MSLSEKPHVPSRRIWPGALATTAFLLVLAASPAGVAALLAGRDPLTLALAVGQVAVLSISVAVVAEARWLR